MKEEEEKGEIMLLFSSFDAATIKKGKEERWSRKSFIWENGIFVHFFWLGDKDKLFSL